MSEDNALRILHELLDSGEYRVDGGLVRQCYEIQKQFQFDRDREIPLDRVRRLVEAEVARDLQELQQEEGAQ